MKLQVDSYGICTQPFHLAKILSHRRPFGTPIFLQQTHAVIAVIIEAPWPKGFSGSLLDKSLAVFRNSDPIQLCVRAGSVVGRTAREAKQGQHKDAEEPAHKFGVSPRSARLIIK
jgi:hypothetical protein